jgi:hypothetical protein
MGSENFGITQGMLQVDEATMTDPTKGYRSSGHGTTQDSN